MVHHSRAVHGHHTCASHRAQCPQINLGAALDADHVRLTRFGGEACLAPIVEERIQPRAINEDVSGRKDPQTPSFFAAGVAVAGTEVRVEVGVAGCEAAVESCGIGLHVWRFGLQDTGVDILGVGKLKIVELTMFRAGTVHPDWTLRFDEDASPIVDVDLVVVGEVELVVCDPEPVVLKVDCRFGSDVQQQKRAFTVWVVVGCDIGILGAGIALQVSTSRATYAHMDIPHARGTLRGFGDIPLDHDCSRCWAFGFKYKITHFDSASVAWLADLKDRSWRCLVSECGAGGHDKGPNLPSHLDVAGDFDGRRDDVCTMIEVKDLIRGETVHG